MSRGLIVWLFASCLSGAAAAAAESPNCATPVPHNGRADSAAVAFSLLDADGTPTGKNTVWQPLGGTVAFSLQGNGLADKPPIVCFAYHGGGFEPSPRVWRQGDAATNTFIYNATVPSKLDGSQRHLAGFFTAARTGIVALSARIRVIVPDGKDAALTDVTVPIGITSAVLSAILALIALVLAFAFVFGVARWLNVPGKRLLKVISTRNGVASLSQLQVILWSFVIYAGAVYVMAISGTLIDISNGALVLLGISGAATVGSKLQNAQNGSSQSPSGAQSAQQKPGQVVGLRTVGDPEETEISLAWSEPASGGPARTYRVQYRLGSAANPPTPGPWLTVGETVTATRYRVINLEPNTRYDFRVAAVNEYGDAEQPSDPITRATAARTVVAGAPDQVAGLRLGRPPELGRIDLVWARAAGATSYQVQRRPHGSDDAWTDCDPSGVPSIAIQTGIDSAGRYDFRVAAVNTAGDGPWSSVLVAQAQRQPLWADLVIKPNGANEIDVTRMQMLFFTVVTAVFVALKIVYSYTIPDIPAGFLVLMGISNGIYLTAKFVPD